MQRSNVAEFSVGCRCMCLVLTEQLQSVTFTPLTMTFRGTLFSTLPLAAVRRWIFEFSRFQTPMNFQSRNSCIAAPGLTEKFIDFNLVTACGCCCLIRMQSQPFGLLNCGRWENRRITQTTDANKLKTFNHENKK